MKNLLLKDKIFSKYNFKDKSGSALVLTMFILAGMIVVALSGSYVMVLSLQASGTQSQSTKAYFAAESGAEEILYEIRKNSWSFFSEPTSLTESIEKFNKTLGSGVDYKVYYTNRNNPIIFNSVGSFNETKRSVQIRMN